MVSMPDFPSHFGASGEWRTNYPDIAHSGGYSPRSMSRYQHSRTVPSKFYTNRNHLATPHLGQAGRILSSSTFRDKRTGLSTNSPPFDHVGAHPLPSSGPPVFRGPPNTYQYPFNTHYHHPSTAPPMHPMPVYSYYSHPHPPPVWSSMATLSFPVVEYITELGPDDVLSGRGGATNSYKGNRAFRSLIKEYQAQYLRAKKRDKPAVASIIVELIRHKGGRFLRRCDDRTNPNGTVLWVDIGDDRAREKACQALREGAPEIRRTKFSRSSMPSYEDDEIRDQRSFASTSADAKDSDTTSPGSVTIIRSSSKSVKWDGSDDEDDGDLTPGTVNGKTYHHHSDAQSVRIVPWSRLLPDRPIVEAMDLDKLSMEDRDMYLRDFFPPDPFIRMSWNIESPNSSPGRGDSLADSPMAQSNDDILLEEDFDLTVAAQPER